MGEAEHWLYLLAPACKPASMGWSWRGSSQIFGGCPLPQSQAVTELRSAQKPICKLQQTCVLPNADYLKDQSAGLYSSIYSTEILIVCARVHAHILYIHTHKASHTYNTTRNLQRVYLSASETSVHGWMLSIWAEIFKGSYKFWVMVCNGTEHKW